MKPFIRWTLLGIVVLAAVGAYSLWNQPHTDFKELEAVVQLSDSDVVASFSGETSPWLNQPIEVRGKVVSSSANSLLLEAGVMCQWSEEALKEGEWVGQTVTVHGRLVGFDALFGEARLDQCALR
jgi:hypothetical protein